LSRPAAKPTQTAGDTHASARSASRSHHSAANATTTRTAPQTSFAISVSTSAQTRATISSTAAHQRRPNAQTFDPIRTIAVDVINNAPILISVPSANASLLGLPSNPSPFPSPRRPLRPSEPAGRDVRSTTSSSLSVDRIERVKLFHPSTSFTLKTTPGPIDLP